jgi:CRISPR-associated protein Cas2
MSLNETASWIVAYDIAHPRRLARVFSYIKRQGIPLQNSVFVVEASNATMDRFMAHIATLIDARDDDVRAYRLPKNGWRTTLGSPKLPDDVWLA